jgi:hypothetical protein
MAAFTRRGAASCDELEPSMPRTAQAWSIGAKPGNVMVTKAEPL